ncbi:MAG: bifunctional helix-turn-helix transcriptional regulator/GNAT family N-acetyltransferase [Ignavibacteriaceae bacterium]|nr:bifunctional helix-turn-helix transcriptional regulator/GNAT family N-acetyltransferase [Ignavibacteriaceae bacterium]
MDIKNFSTPGRIKKLGENLLKEASLVCQKFNIEFEPRWFAICRFLNEKGSAPINEIASAIELTHPAIVQLVNELEKHNIVRTSKDNEDKRKRIVSLSDKGKEALASVEPLFNDLDESIIELGKSSGYDIPHFINSLEKLTGAKSLYTLTLEKYKKRLLDSVEILRYSPQYRKYFKELNYEWLNKYFKIEELDEEILSNPEEIIINKGGEIFFARINGEIVGTCAAIKIDDNTYELAKMAVTEKAQGKQAGKKLAFAVIGFAYSNEAKSVILETNSGLHSAIALYESIGFKSVPGMFDSKYTRQTFRMKLDLK